MVFWHSSTFQEQFEFESMVARKSKEKDILVSTYNKSYIKLKKGKTAAT